MRKLWDFWKNKKYGKKSMTALLSSAMVLTLPGVNELKVQAASVINRDDNSIVYSVDCGDIDVTTVPEDGSLGTHNSVTDQVYGADKKTGYKWGVVDTVSSPLVNGSSSAGGVTTDWTWAYEFAGGDQTSKTGTNRYTKNQYEKNTNNGERKLDYKFEIENGSYYVEVGFADPWGCSKSPSVYANLGEKDETAIAKDFSVSSNSGVVTGMVTVTNGELTIDARGTGDNNKAINMTYITIKEAGEKILAQTDIDALNIPEIATGDIELPTRGSKAESDISWSSSDESIITKEGKVTRPESGYTYGNSKKRRSNTYKGICCNGYGTEGYD